MKAANVLLTHFSSRYPRLPDLKQYLRDTGGDSPVVGIAFDLSTVPIGAMKRLHNYLPIIEQQISKRYEEEEVAAPGADTGTVVTI